VYQTPAGKDCQAKTNCPVYLYSNMAKIYIKKEKINKVAIVAIQVIKDKGFNKVKKDLNFLGEGEAMRMKSNMTTGEKAMA